MTPVKLRGYGRRNRIGFSLRRVHMNELGIPNYKSRTVRKFCGIPRMAVGDKMYILQSDAVKADAPGG